MAAVEEAKLDVRNTVLNIISFTKNEMFKIVRLYTWVWQFYFFAVLLCVCVGENRVYHLEWSNHNGFFFPISVYVIPVYASILMFRCMMTLEEPYKGTS